MSPVDIARFRDQHVVDPSGVNDPTVIVLDLTAWQPTVSALVEYVVPLAQSTRAGRLGPLALVICTEEPHTREVLRALAQLHDLALFVAPAPDRLSEAEPFGPLTETERGTLEVMQRLGGNVSVADFADATGLAPTAATNRLMSLSQKGFVQKVDRGRPAGSVFLDPRSAVSANKAPHAQLPPALRREVELFAAVAGVSADQMLDAACREYEEDHASLAANPALVVRAWQAYRKRHSGQLSERLRWAQEMLADPARAAVEMSGMADEDIDELRSEFG